MRSISEIISTAKRLTRGTDLPDAIREHLSAVDRSELRRKLSRKWHVLGLTPTHRAGVRRRIKSISRQGKKYHKSARLSTEEHVLILRKRRNSILLDSLFPERRVDGGWLQLADRRIEENLRISLKHFSFFDDPAGTLNGLREIAKAEASAGGFRIDFDDEYCLDIVPYMLLMEFWDHMLPVAEGGGMTVATQKVLASTGLPQAMGIGISGVQDFDNVWAFPLSRRRGAGATESKCALIDIQSREVVIDQFCEALDDWLGEVNKMLTAKGIGWIKNILGELLENAERHSDGARRDGTWSVSGFMVRRVDPEDGVWRFHVHLGIVNLGDTFSESLERSTKEVRSELDNYVRTIQANGASQSAETLRTLAALQDGVTCVAEADADDRGGYGLQEMLDLVNLLGSTQVTKHKPRVTIVSGGACIQLRDPYINGSRDGGADGPRVLWCNETNSRLTPPDLDFVYDLATPLPGTAISVKFTLDDEFYKGVRLEGA